MSKININVALIGNPNVGKTSIFNLLTGLHQQVGNYPGVTVDKKLGFCDLSPNLKANILDLPGTYSLNASSADENVVIEVLLNKNDKLFPDVIVVVTEIENLKRNLLLFTQIKDLEIPTILVINMIDRMKSKGISIDVDYLETVLKTKIVLVSSRKNIGIDSLKKAIATYKSIKIDCILNLSTIDSDYFGNLQKTFPNQSIYKLWLVITQDVNFANLKRNDFHNNSFSKNKTELKQLQQKETIKRYQFINNTLKKGLNIDVSLATDFRSKLDRVLIHKVFGYILFFVILFGIFQSIFEWSKIPMDFIDSSFSDLSQYILQTLPSGTLTNLIAQGIVPGIGGILIFIPQIAFLFLFISILEESGYMSRVVFLMDKIMRRFGLSGKSVVPLVSGTACAIPAIMATRNIENWRERLITILVTPFTTCSARLPVYTIIIGIVIPDKMVFGIMNLQGLTLMLLYLIGFGTSILAAFILNKILQHKSKTYFVIEMPNYKLPMLKNVMINVLEKTKSFVFGAGKIILSLSVILWFMASYGPNDNFKNAETIVKNNFAAEQLSSKDLQIKTAAFKLENSYIGLMGKTIEPVIAPLGYDWKIGIAIISSFAAREVFVGTLATIYSVGNTENDNSIKIKMAQDINPKTGLKVFNFASGISLLLFYAFAMQCVSTLAITKRETNSWRWPFLQLITMSVLAYLMALIAFQILK